MTARVSDTPVASPRYQGRRKAVARWAQRQDDFTVDDVMVAHSMLRDNAAKTLGRLVVDGLVRRVGLGVYRSSK